MRARLSWALGAVVVLGLSWSAAARAADLAAEEQAIRSLDAQWVVAVASRDAEGSAAFYAEDGLIMPPGAPPAQGRTAIAAVWQSFMDLADFALIFAPARIVVAESADVAWEVGTYDLSYTADTGPVFDSGKYVVAWKKVDGEWKIGADIFNSNGPAE